MQSFKNILCVVSSDKQDDIALERAKVVAENNQAKLTVVEVIEKISSRAKLPDPEMLPEKLQAAMFEERREKLLDRISPWNKHGNIKVKILIGKPYLAVTHEVLQSEQDLLIKTAENGGLLDRVFGSDDMQLLRNSPCPVWLVKSESSKEYKRILAAVDVDDSYADEELKVRRLLNLRVLEMAASLALSEFAELHVVCVWEPIGEGAMRVGFMKTGESKVSAYLEKLRRHYDQSLSTLVDEIANKLGAQAFEYMKLQKHLLKGSPRKEIPAFAKDMMADLVVMGTVARTGVPGFFMGNTAENIFNRLNCSVLAVKPEGFVTPVTL